MLGAVLDYFNQSSNLELGWVAELAFSLRLLKCEHLSSSVLGQACFTPFFAGQRRGIFFGLALGILELASRQPDFKLCRCF